ncbi:hypothetical protein BC941DRAFT_434356 [Chlamydoabsidia padenii]|nr:hypothetical protein BC941DRAFT_434356 [Chlamydoabsidia padenii]
MGRGEKVDYRISMLVVLCKDCNQDVGLYPARHQCQVERPPLPPLPPLPVDLEKDATLPPPTISRKASSPGLSRFASTRSTTEQPITRAQSTSRWSPSSRFGRSTNSKTNSPTEEKEDTSYFDHFSAHLPDTSAEQSTPTSLKKKWGGSIRQNEKWKQLNDKVDQQKQQQSSPKLWKRLVQATQNMTIQDDQGPESDESDWEGESHISRILRQYHEQKQQKLPPWLLTDQARSSYQDTSSLDRQTSRRRLWDNNAPTARDRELETLRQDQRRTSARQQRPTMMHDSDHSDDVDDYRSLDTRQDDYLNRKNKRLERMQSARRCMEDQYRDNNDVQQEEGRSKVHRQYTMQRGSNKVDEILTLRQARQAALSRSRSDRAIRSAYNQQTTEGYNMTATEITPTNYRSFMKQDKPLDDLTLQRPKQRYLVPEKRDGLGLF